MLKLFSAAGLITLMSAGAYCALAPVSRAADASSPYRISKSISLGAPERWDYLTYEPVSNRVFVGAWRQDRCDRCIQ